MEKITHQINTLDNNNETLTKLFSNENQNDLEDAYNYFLFNEETNNENIKKIVKKIEEISTTIPITEIKSFIFKDIEENNNFTEEFNKNIIPILEKLKVSEKESEILLKHIKEKDFSDITVMIDNNTYLISDYAEELETLTQPELFYAFSSILKDVFEKNKEKLENNKNIKTEMWFEVF